MSGTPRYGQHPDPTICRRERAAIREIARLASEYGGMSPGRIAESLNKGAYQKRTRDGGPWARSTVLAIIKANPRVMARMKKIAEIKERRYQSEQDARKAFLDKAQKVRESGGEPAWFNEYVWASPDERAEALLTGQVPTSSMYFDEETGDWKEEEVSLSLADLEQSIHDDAQRRIQAAALKRLSLAERAERFRFQPVDEVLLFNQACSNGGIVLCSKDEVDRDVDLIVAQTTRSTRKDVHALIDQIKDQPGVKGPLRRLVNGMLREIAIQRQANLVLREKDVEKIRRWSAIQEDRQERIDPEGLARRRLGSRDPMRRVQLDTVEKSGQVADKSGENV